MVKTVADALARGWLIDQEDGRFGGQWIASKREGPHGRPVSCRGFGPLNELLDAINRVDETPTRGATE